MVDPIDTFLKHTGLETAVYVREIAPEDTTLMVDIYTRDPHNALQTLIDLKAAIDGLLEEWNTGKYNKIQKPCVYHAGGKWPLHILRPPAGQPFTQKS